MWWNAGTSPCESVHSFMDTMIMSTTLCVDTSEARVFFSNNYRLQVVTGTRDHDGPWPCLHQALASVVNAVVTVHPCSRLFCPWQG